MAGLFRVGKFRNTRRAGGRSTFNAIRRRLVLCAAHPSALSLAVHPPSREAATGPLGAAPAYSGGGEGSGDTTPLA
jgi:hypothetical protein